MKFVHRHHSDILRIFNEQGLSASDFDFVKKRGRICTRHQSTAQEFAYLRIKEIQIDPNTREWKHVEWFKVKSDGVKEREVQNWDQVMELFEEWVFGIHHKINHSSQICISQPCLCV